MSARARRIAWAAGVAIVLGAVVLGTRAVASDDPLVVGDAPFDAGSFGEDTFAVVRDGVVDRAIDADRLAAAIADDPEAAAAEYAVQSSGGPVFSVTLTGVLQEGRSGVLPIVVDGLPAELVVRVQTGPAITGTELRDATGDITFGQFTNQIDYQDAAAALNDEMKRQVLGPLDGIRLPGTTVTVTGAFTLVDPDAWLITPVDVESR